MVDSSSDVVVENDSEGTDTVQASIAYTLGGNVENLILTGSGNLNGTGNSLNNNISGNSGDNVLTGGAGNDTLDGGFGNDRLIGGVGNDAYVVDSINDVVVENAGEGTDTVQASINYILGANVENLILTGSDNLNGTGNSINNIITGNDGDNVLDGGAGADTLTGGLGNDTYLIDSSDVVTENVDEGTDTVQASIGYTLGANLENLTLTGSGNLNGTGNSLDNIINGNSGDNVLTGGAGNDTLDGGFGNDMLIGGVGNDIYVVDSISDVVVENAGEGTDTVQASIGYTLGANLENLTLTGNSNLNGTGNSLNNIINGNSGDNVLDGGAGADTLTGGLGNDTYAVDSTSDVVVENDNEGTDTVKTSIDYTLGANVENLILTGNSNLNGAGNSLDNIINGNRGDNVLDGGAGADTLTGGLGNDTYLIDSSDVVTENVDEGTDTVQASINYTLGANLENLTLTGSGNLNGTGNSLDNVINGNSGNNVLDGRMGDDVLRGGLGDDTYLYGSGSGNDTICSYEGAGGNGSDAVQFGTGLNSSSLEFQKNGQDLVVQIKASRETLTFTNWFDGANYQVDKFRFADNSILSAEQVSIMATDGRANTIIGTAGNDTLTGGVSADSIYGLEGNDLLDGRTGADTLVGGVGNDTYVVDDTSDAVVENDSEGTDTVEASITYTLGANVENLTLTGTAAINGTGNSLDNVITGNSGNNVLTGGAGNDTLNGGFGNDTLIGGVDNDTYVVGDTSDVVVENNNEGTDTVEANITYTLGANVENLILTGTAAINGTGNSLGNVIIGNRGNNVLDGRMGDDVLRGGLGDDTYLYGIGSGNDTICSYEGAGGSGSDTVQFGSGLSSSSLEFQKNGQDLVVQIRASGETLTFTNWFNGANYQVDKFRFADNSILRGAQVSDRATGGGANTIIGTVGNDTIDGYYSGSILCGEGGDDRIWDHQGYSTLYGGAGNDYLRNISYGHSILYGDDGDDDIMAYVGYCTLYGGAGNDYLNCCNNSVIYGGDGNDQIMASESNCTAYGGAGNDHLESQYSSVLYGDDGDDELVADSYGCTLYGGAGNDVMWESAATDTLYYGDDGDDYIINYGDNSTLYGGTGNDTLENFGIDCTLYGDDGDDYIISSGYNCTLHGGTGNDTLESDGSDVLYGDDGNDHLSGNYCYGGDGNDIYAVGYSGINVVEDADEGTDTVEANITYTLGANVENLTLTGTAAINGTGNSLNNVITGNSGSNVLDGGAGADTLLGGSGNDTYIWTTGAGNDTVDNYHVDSSTDTLQFQNLVMASIGFSTNNNDLVCTNTQTGESVRLLNWTLGAGYQVQQFQFTDGTLTAVQVNQKIA